MSFVLHRHKWPRHRPWPLQPKKPRPILVQAIVARPLSGYHLQRLRQVRKAIRRLVEQRGWALWWDSMRTMPACKHFATLPCDAEEAHLRYLVSLGLTALLIGRLIGLSASATTHHCRAFGVRTSPDGSERNRYLKTLPFSPITYRHPPKRERYELYKARAATSNV